MDYSRAQQTAPLRPPRYCLVATPCTFQGMVEVLKSATRIGVDIEADSLYHYYEKVCLIQISTVAETFVIDPLALGDLSGLAPVMADRQIEKIFHAATYDVSCLRRDYEFSFNNIFDTHMAAQLLGYDQLGLSALLGRLLQVAHSKRRQRDDWSRRPLVPEQLEYAAMDTQHLLELRDLLETELQEKRRIEWAYEEFEAVASCAVQEKTFDPEGYRRIKGCRNLSLKQMAVLKSLYGLRDRFAREMDLPPFKVLNNPVLLDLSRKPPGSYEELVGRAGISYRVARRFAAEIYGTIEEARSLDPQMLALPVKNSWKPPSADARVRLEFLKGWRQAKSRELGLHVGVLFPGNLLEALATFPPSDVLGLQQIETMRRWRAREFGSEILDILRRS